MGEIYIGADLCLQFILWGAAYPRMLHKHEMLVHRAALFLSMCCLGVSMETPDPKKNNNLILYFKVIKIGPYGHPYKRSKKSWTSLNSVGSSIDMKYAAIKISHKWSQHTLPFLNSLSISLEIPLLASPTLHFFGSSIIFFTFIIINLMNINLSS